MLAHGECPALRRVAELNASHHVDRPVGLGSLQPRRNPRPPSSGFVNINGAAVASTGVRVLRTSCTGCSSMHPTRWCGSYGGQSFPALLHGRSGLGTGCRRDRPVLEPVPTNATFMVPRDGFVADQAHDAEYDNLPDQQA